MFIDNPPKYMNVNTTIMEIGILRVTIAEDLTLLKKNSKTRKAKTPPCSAASRTPFIASLMNID